MKFKIPWGIATNAIDDIEVKGYLEVEAANEMLAIEQAADWIFAHIAIGEPEKVED